LNAFYEDVIGMSFNGNECIPDDNFDGWVYLDGKTYRRQDFPIAWEYYSDGSSD